MKHFQVLCLRSCVALFFFILGLQGISFGAPVSDITVNSSNGPISVSTNYPVSVFVQFDPSTQAGMNVDWWIGVNTSLGAPYDWLQFGIHPFCQGPLHLREPFQILQIPLPAGSYTFVAALDDCMDGNPALIWWDLAQVRVDPVPLFAEKLQLALDEGMLNNGGIGGSAALIVPGHGTWVGASGVSYPGLPVTPRMLFPIASATKNFVAALVLQLVEEGRLSLDDPISKWLPSYSYTNIDNRITVRQLLNHTGGVFSFEDHPDAFDALLFSDPLRVWTPEEIFANFLLPPPFSPGGGWLYSNTGYLILGRIIEAVTGSSVSAQLRTRFLNPLGLNDTFLMHEEPVTKEIAHSWHDFDGDGFPEDITSLHQASYYSSIWTAGAMVATAEDLARWIHLLFHEGRVLQDASLEQMLDFYGPIVNTPPISGYGLGAVEIVFAGETFWGHSGGDFGITAAGLYLPATGCALAILLNLGEDEKANVIMTEILSGILNVLEANQ
ncbi:MAG: beta-lactamase family protein [Deltaproteobacteria bacterium]|nr:beta-lactamase family protein [Deltaproteobacteria bacterium]